VWIVWIPSINKAGAADGEKSFDLADRLGDYVVRRACLKLNKSMICCVESVSQHRGDPIAVLYVCG